MDSAIFRWVLVLIALALALAIYLIGKHQSRLRQRSAIETFTRAEVDSAFIEDEQLRSELDNLNRILLENGIDEELGQIHINPGLDVSSSPLTAKTPKIFVPRVLLNKPAERLISHHLRYSDYRLITGEEVAAAIQHLGLESPTEPGYLRYREQGELVFEIASLSAPGLFSQQDRLNFTTLGLNCFIDLDNCGNPQRAYELMLKKIDELVRMLNLKVYLSNQELLTIDHVAGIREQLGRYLTVS